MRPLLQMRLPICHKIALIFEDKVCILIARTLVLCGPSHFRFEVRDLLKFPHLQSKLAFAFWLSQWLGRIEESLMRSVWPGKRKLANLSTEWLTKSIWRQNHLSIFAIYLQQPTEKLDKVTGNRSITSLLLIRQANDEEANNSRWDTGVTFLRQPSARWRTFSELCLGSLLDDSTRGYC